MTSRHIQRKVAFCQGGCSAMMIATTRPTVTCKPCYNKQRREAGRKPAHEKITTCSAGCGGSVRYATSDRVYCSDCGPVIKRDRARIAAEKKRRASGVSPVKGTSIICAECGTAFTRAGVKAKFCVSCRPLVSLRMSRESSKAKRETQEGRDYSNAWHRNKRKIDPAWRVNSHMRVMVHRGIGKKKAGRSWSDFLPYSLGELMTHLERQFTKGMAWEKVWPEIHIDHIMPLSSFNITGPDCPDFKAAWCLSNLRPMWAEGNLRKNATRTHLI